LARASCVICAWREACKKQFSMADPSHCPDFARDLSIKDYPGKKGVKILVQGAPGTGKTTLIERLVTKLNDRKTGGFFTREMREKGERVGFRIVTLDKREGVLAHRDLHGGLKVGKYTVNLEDLENVAVDSIIMALREDDLILIDEIGKMELFSNHFKEIVEAAINHEKPLVATVALDGPPFTEEIKSLPGVHLLTLTAANRDELLEEVMAHLRGDIP